MCRHVGLDVSQLSDYLFISVSLHFPHLSTVHFWFNFCVLLKRQFIVCLAIVTLNGHYSGSVWNDDFFVFASGSVLHSDFLLGFSSS